MKRLILVSLFLLFLALPLLGESFLESDFFKTIINWGDLSVSAEVKETLPKIIFEEDDPEYGKPNTATNKSRSDLLARKNAKEKLRKLISRRLESMYLDSEQTVSEYAKLNEQVRTRINSFIAEEKEEFEFEPVKNQLVAKAKIKLIGKNGFLAFLPMSYSSEAVPEMTPELMPEMFTGLVVDARHLNLKTALFPRIQTDRGLDIYSPHYVKEGYSIETGYIMYRTDSEEKNWLKRVGDKPFFVVALGVAGRNQTDLILPSEEVAKLLSHKETRKNLTRCKVLILVSK
ncbi:hypothetical protein LPTSP4_06180 [Leptospira ryugenii]|uniref:Uncharacterized protein n=1 Tax=Leptospira ryugenii TaxID=1917863 RepID=A0A2P2DWU9_9LEPT|nr:hypothetical protein [Leptospira ryugenii]GBF49108.1 hypothetical protein LPTSP4_06180 [Leptospira ryugenii]